MLIDIDDLEKEKELYKFKSHAVAHLLRLRCSKSASRRIMLTDKILLIPTRGFLNACSIGSSCYSEFGDIADLLWILIFEEDVISRYLKMVGKVQIRL